MRARGYAAAIGRPKAEPSAPATPDRILSAAESQFAAVGYRAAKLADIATAVGIRRSSLLYHFGSKEELYAATVERVFARLGDSLRASMSAEGPFEERLLSTASGYAEFLGAQPEVARIVLREFLDKDGPGAELLVEQVAPLLDAVEAFVVSAGRDELQPDLPIRAAIMQIATDLLVRTAAGAELRQPLWGDVDAARDLTRHLFLGR